MTLRLVSGFSKLAHREKLMAEAVKLFPNEQSRREKWVEAKLILGDTEPKCRVGKNDRQTFPRTLREAGATGEM